MAKLFRIAFVTSVKHPGFTTDDTFLVDALDNFHCDCFPCAWDDPEVHWNSFDMILLRSPWNYHLMPLEFARWIKGLPARVLFNPRELVLWNMDKRYLQHLQHSGVHIPSTVWLDKTDATSLEATNKILKGSEHCIIKPCISASSFKTRKVGKNELAEVIRVSMQDTREGGMMIQEYIDQITKGEMSLVYFGGHFSHAVLKEPKSGDFRVQSEFGGTVKAMQAPDHLIKEGQRILSLLPVPPLYARVDGIERDGRFVLMEVELIEPVLFFGMFPESAYTFAGIIQKVLKQKRTILL